MEDDDGAARLYAACYKGHANAARLLIERGADVGQARDDGTTPLFAACQNGHDDVARLLIEKDADVGQVEKNGATPLYVACQNGHGDVARLLIEKGAEVGQADNDGASPLFMTLRPCHCPLTRRGHVKIVRLLLRGGADIWQANDSGVSPISLARERSATSNAPDGSAAELILKASSSRAWTKLLVVFFAIKLIVCVRRARERVYMPGGSGARAAEASFARNVRQRVG